MTSRLTKWLIGIALGLVLVVLIAPLGVGMMAEDRYKQLWQNGLETTPGYQAEVVEYDRGWFNARTRVRLAISEPTTAGMLIHMGMADEDADGTATLYLDERVHHGPFPLSASAPLSQRLKPGFAAVDSQPDHNLPFFRDHNVMVLSTTHIGLLGGIDTFVRTGPFDLPIGDDLRLINEGAISANIRSNLDLEWIDADLRSGEIRLQDHQGNGVAMDAFSGQSNQHRGPADLWLGKTEFGFESLRALGQGPAFRMEELVWSAVTNERGEFVGQTHEVKLRSFSTNGVEAGPIRLHYDLFNLHPQALADLQTAMAESPAFDESDPDSFETVFSEYWLEPLLALAEHRPGISFSQLEVELLGGAISGDGELQVRDLARNEMRVLLDEARVGVLANGEGQLSTSRDQARRVLAMGMMGATDDTELDEGMIEMLDQQIEMFISEGLLLETADDRLEMQLHLEDGVLRFNGETMAEF